MGPDPGQHSAATSGAAARGDAGHADPGDGVRIEMRLREIGQLFDPIDPSPLGQQDLSAWAEEYIVESVKEVSSGPPYELVIILDQQGVPVETESEVADAVRAHFVRQAALRRRSFRRLMRRGGISLVIGIAFLAAFFGVSRLIIGAMGDGPVVTLLREGSLIVGWVAMWRPLEIFLYDWWPIVGERRLHQRLGQIGVRVIAAGRRDTGS